MKSFRICKSTVSMILALIMLVSMCTVAFVNVSAAEADVAETGATIPSGTVLYLNPGTWNTSNPVYFCHVFKSGTNTTADYKATLDSESEYYKVTVSGSSFDSYLWVRMPTGSASVNWDTIWNKTNDISYNGSHNLCKITGWDQSNFECSTYTPPADPTGPIDPDLPTDFDITEEGKVYVRDDTTSNPVDEDDANLMISFDNKASWEMMTKTVDTKSGHDLYVYDEVPSTVHTTIYFRRVSAIDDNDDWASWSATTADCITGLYRITNRDSGIGSWGTAAHSYGVPNKKDINNFSYGVWADIKGNGNAYDSVVARKVSKNEFHLYLPSNTPSNVTLYTSFATLEINDTAVTDGTAISLPAGESHTMSYAALNGETPTDATLKVYRTSGVATMLMDTNRLLHTELADANEYLSDVSIYKDAIETKGSYHFYTEDGTWLNAPVMDDGEEVDMTVLKKIKGRGNSSFEASMRIYGKYAYNFNLDEKIELIDGSTASKKWCMLANNVDHSMMRNTFIYQLADDMGMTMGPETRLVDVYDNGNYLGAFVITEKVEYGKNTLMAKDSVGEKINNLDDANVEANSVYPLGEDGEPNTKADPLYEFDTDDLNAGIETTIPIGGKTYKYKYYATYDRPAYKDENGVEQPAADNLTFETPENYNTKYNYLLEHELSSRYTAEASWFITPKGQPVVVKYPEFATKAEMEWIINEYAAMEQAVYASGEEDLDEIGQLIDVESFAKMYLIHELAINLDSCATSYYIHNEYINGKSVLFAGPTWDFDWALGAYAGNTKWIYNGSSVTTSANMSDPKQMFAKNKAIQTDGSPSNNVTWEANYNLQAKLAHNDEFWTECQRIYTNEMVDLLYKYTKDSYDDANDTGVIVDEWLPKFESSMDMNNARWGVYTKNDDWGTKVTTDYVKGSGLTSTSGFNIGNTGTSGSASKCYANTVYYLNDWIKVRKDYMSGTGDLYNADLLETYEISDVDFEGVLNDENGELTVTPSATVTFNGEAVSTDNYFYTVYLDGEAVTEPIPFSTESTTINLVEGKYNTVYVLVTVKDSNENAPSDEQTFPYKLPDASVTVYFKSSSSYRYVPSVEVNGVTTAMEKTGSAISKNATQTQQYFWYKATLTAQSDTTLSFVFTNSYMMRASASITVTDGATYYFGCNNLNNGTTAVDITSLDENIRNFVKSATNMLVNDPEAAGVATTSLDGTIYKMGDTDGDDTLSVMDATRIQLALAEKTELNKTGKALADYDLDGDASIMDASCIQTYLVQ